MEPAIGCAGQLEGRRRTRGIARTSDAGPDHRIGIRQCDPPYEARTIKVFKGPLACRTLIGNLCRGPVLQAAGGGQRFPNPGVIRADIDGVAK
ncbi:hypothetical protein GCM10027565_16720 [Bordetella tumulicola]